MTLNSLDVQNKTFNPQFRGFSKHEVDEFLDIVVRDYDEFAQTIKDQERELKALRERVKYFDHVTDHALITWLSCTDHETDHALITSISCTDHMTAHALIRSEEHTSELQSP